MSAIPRTLTLLAHGSPQDLTRLLIAAILSSEEEMLILSDEKLREAQQYKLITTVGEDGLITLIAELQTPY
jgi:hypothetical protein